METSATKRQLAIDHHNNGKESKSLKTELHFLLAFAREMWGRDKNRIQSTATEDCNFHEFFGCGAIVAHNIWQLLVDNCLLPDGGCMNHLLWALMLMKVYGKEKTMCSMKHTPYPKF